MTIDRSGPADTAMMRIVHNALRRDLDRALSVLRADTPPEAAQRIALARHVGWMMHFLHLHHESEDEFLYPMVRAANPSAADLIDRMATDHDAISAAMTDVRNAAERYSAIAGSRTELADALDDLSEVLLPHLRSEEDVMMPVVSASITDQQWHDWDQRHNVKPLNKKELAFTGLWLLDNATPADDAIISHEVPAVPRFLIKHLLARGYQKAMFRVFGLATHSRLKASLGGRVEVISQASPLAIWRIITDVRRIGEWSHECHTADWLDGAAGPAIGARFRGRNRSGMSRWSRPCTILSCTEPFEFSFRTSGKVLKDSTEWRFRIEPIGDRTRIVQQYKVISLPIWADRLLWRMTPAHHDRTAELAGDLARLSNLAERESAVTVA